MYNRIKWSSMKINETNLLVVFSELRWRPGWLAHSSKAVKGPPLTCKS